MAKTPRSERARLFVALDLPDQARAAIAAWRDQLLAGAGELRPVPAEALHVTLAFLGWRELGEAGAIAEACSRAAEGLRAPVLVPAGVRPVPPRRPRLLALDLDDEGGRCGRLQAAVSDALEAGGFYTPEKRPFWPHVTLARAKRGAKVRPPQGAPPPSVPFEAGRLTLYRSILHPAGARYDPVARCRLGRG